MGQKFAYFYLVLLWVHMGMFYGSEYIIFMSNIAAYIFPKGRKVIGNEVKKL